MKRGVRVINLARGEIVDDEAMLTALDTGMVAAYITDFPNNRLLTAPHVIAMPHLGASTPESEQNCAAMAVDTLRDYLESGNIRSSVNLPEMTMDRSGVQRLCVLHKNVPGMLANITSLFWPGRRQRGKSRATSPVGITPIPWWTLAARWVTT